MFLCRAISTLEKTGGSKTQDPVSEKIDSVVKTLLDQF